MVWNWQQPDWPLFAWNRARFETAEQQFLVDGGVLVGTVKHLGSEEQDELAIEAMSSEALTTSPQVHWPFTLWRFSLSTNGRRGALNPQRERCEGIQW